MIAALYVEKGGCYFGLPDVDPWDEVRDARLYAGPDPVVAHPPCKRWGRYWHGAPNKPHQFRLGDDDGCFAAALAAVRAYGGVLEHPAHSHAWRAFGLRSPHEGQGWTILDEFGGSSCHVEQGHYGHIARKGTWLYIAKCALPILDWTRGAQRLPSVQLERNGYARARRCGVMAAIGGRDRDRIRAATPPEFRDLLIAIAQDRL